VTARRRKYHDVNGWPVMPAQCKTCPFNEDGDRYIREGVLSRIVPMKGSQICHHPTLEGKPETHLCRGARDIQLRILTALGHLSEPTDAAFAAKSAELLGEPPKAEGERKRISRR
jgi:hypothetical protein